MGLFGSTTKLSSTTTSNATDRRTLAESGGVAAQSVGGDLILDSGSEEAIEAISLANAGLVDFAKSGLTQIAQSSENALGIVAASKGTQPVNPVLVIVAIGAAFWLAKGGKFA